MREIIVREWRDNLGIVHRDEVGELVQLEKGLKMLWEAHDKTCKNIEVAGEKILEIFNGWYIDKAIYPDKKWGKDMNSIIIEIRRDKPSCENCHFNKYGPSYTCEQCSRNWEDNYKED